MKVLQITKNNKPLEVPRILESDDDFNAIIDNWIFDRKLQDNDNYGDPIYSKEICNLSDCFQSRQLFEVDGHCEFDILIYIDDGIEYEYIFVFHPTKKTFGLLTNQGQDSKYFIPINSELYKDYGKPSKTPGSIFINENQRKHPKLLDKALGLLTSS